MREHPILFTGAMVRAILAGNKTQTRRIINPQPSESFMPQVGRYHRTLVDERVGEQFPSKQQYFGASDENEDYVCPFGEPGDRLWVKETFAPMIGGGFVYAAEYSQERLKQKDGHGFWKPSIFCSRKASRLTLEIEAVRAERLQNIIESDAIAEGCEASSKVCDSPEYQSARTAYRELWESINGAESWKLNPWVWVIQFRKI